VGSADAPSRAPYRQKESREDDADRIVGAPADRELTTNGRRLRNVVVHEMSAWEVADPAANQSIVQPPHAEETLQKRSPEIHHDSGADPDQGCAYNKFNLFTHLLPFAQVRLIHWNIRRPRSPCENGLAGWP
jgi:hypothetical protein